MSGRNKNNKNHKAGAGAGGSKKSPPTTTTITTTTADAQPTPEEVVTPSAVSSSASSSSSAAVEPASPTSPTSPTSPIAVVVPPHTFAPPSSPMLSPAAAADAEAAAEAEAAPAAPAAQARTLRAQTMPVAVEHGPGTAAAAAAAATAASVAVLATEEDSQPPVRDAATSLQSPTRHSHSSSSSSSSSNSSQMPVAHAVMTRHGSLSLSNKAAVAVAVGAGAAIAAGAAANTAVSEAQRAIRVEMQNIRKADLAKEHVLWQGQHSLEDQYWNYQDARVNTLLKRALQAEKTASELHLYIKKSAKAIQVLAENLSDLQGFGLQETGTCKNACVANDILRKTTATYLTEMKDRVFSEAIKQASQLVVQANKRASTIESITVDMIKQLRIARSKKEEAWYNYEKAAIERVKLEAIDRPVKQDPFLLARSYENSLKALETLEKKYQVAMTQLQKDMQDDEMKRIELMRTIMLDNLLAQKAVLEHTLKFTDQAITQVRGVQPDADIKEFIQSSELVVDPNSPTIRKLRGENVPADAVNAPPPANANTNNWASVFSLSPPDRDPNSMARIYSHEIAKEGVVFRQGKILKSNWKEAYGMVTKSGFFHYFDDKNASAPALTLCLQDCRAELAPNVHAAAFEIVAPNNSFLSRAPVTHFIRAGNPDEAMEWIMALKNYTQNN